MTKINLQDIPEQERKSPRGHYHVHRKNVSIALGRDPESLDLAKRHPFDVTLGRIPPGASICPYHAHSAQWELYVIISGTGTARDESGTQDVRAGDAFVYAPLQAHKLTNTGQEDLVYYVVADNPLNESCYYPDSDKWGVEGPGFYRLIRGPEINYFDGEE